MSPVLSCDTEEGDRQPPAVLLSLVPSCSRKRVRSVIVFLVAYLAIYSHAGYPLSLDRVSAKISEGERP